VRVCRRSEAGLFQRGCRMSKVDDLSFIGAPVDNAVSTAGFIGGMILTKRQKAGLLKDYLGEKGLSLTAEIRRAADAYAEAL